jgi:hypothetical protein
MPSGTLELLSVDTASHGMSRPHVYMLAPAHLVAGLAALLGAQNILVLRFLGMASPILFAGAALALFVLCGCLLRLTPKLQDRIPLCRLGLCVGLAAIVMLFGGEGRFFYANEDWQVRDAVLHDMVRWPWPFAYTGFATPQILRAPIGMYLLPALAGKLGGQVASDLTLLAQNSLVLGSILALGSCFYDSARQRLIASVVVLLFSGMDTVGALLLRPNFLLPVTNGIDSWARIQFSSHLTQAFWVPQHAIAGWLGGLLYMLWRSRKLPLASYLAMLPLIALWSPLGLMGAMPFGALAGLETIWRKQLRYADIALPALALVLSFASLAYMRSDTGRVGAMLFPIKTEIYLIVELTEVVFLLPAIMLMTRGGRFGIATLAVAVGFLLLCPFLVIGHNFDFMMRASIPSLAILSVLAADVVVYRSASFLGRVLIAELAIGAMTPAREVARAVVFQASPAPSACDVSQSWDVTFAEYGKDTYYAGLSTLPRPIRPVSTALAPPTKSPTCWSRAWREDRF